MPLVEVWMMMRGQSHSRVMSRVRVRMVNLIIMHPVPEENDSDQSEYQYHKHAQDYGDIDEAVGRTRLYIHGSG
jgi:hypothetical protein